MENKEQQPHKRRERYKGTHPRQFKDKYKELQPDKYKDAVEELIAKGRTPAGMHISICVKEILDFLQIKPGQNGLDATLGYGGHSMAILKELSGQGHLYALDVDPIEIVKTRQRLAEQGFGPENVTILQQNFMNIDLVAAEYGPFDFMMADLGVSSMQLDNPDRGFTYKSEGPLDLRMDPQKGISAAERLKELSWQELEGMLLENADEPYAAELAKAITSAVRKKKPPETTTQLKQIIEDTLSFLPKAERKDTINKTCQRVFQALRIDVNSEFEALYAFLEKLPNALGPGGRVAILSFHSGEDRLVKKAFKRGLQEGVYSEISTEIIRPSAEECNLNSRARSTKMRWAIRA